MRTCLLPDSRVLLTLGSLFSAASPRFLWPAHQHATPFLPFLLLRVTPSLLAAPPVALFCSSTLCLYDARFSCTIVLMVVHAARVVHMLAGEESAHWMVRCSYCSSHCADALAMCWGMMAEILLQCLG